MDKEERKSTLSGTQVEKNIVVTRSLISSPDSGDCSGSSFYIYNEDWWEMPGATVSDTKPLSPTTQHNMSQTKVPKTDYTYARSVSYTRNSTDESCVSPNMSRRRLREEMANMSASTSTWSKQMSPVINAEESYLSSANMMHKHSDRHRGNRKRRSPSKHSYNYYAELSDQEVEESSNRLIPPYAGRIAQSATRSGCKYNTNWLKEDQKRRHRGSWKDGGEVRHSMGGDMESDISVDQNVEMYHNLPNTLDCSGDDSMHKQRSLKHIYGLDHSETEFSDSEGVNVKGIAQTSTSTVRKTSIFYSMYTFMTAVFTYVTYPINELFGIIWQPVPQDHASMDGTDIAGNMDGTTTTKTTTTTTTTTTTEITEEDEDEFGESDATGGSSRKKQAVKQSNIHTSHASHSWLSRTLKTVITTSTYMLLFPVTVAKDAMSGVVSTGKWVFASNEDTIAEPAVVETASESDFKFSVKEQGTANVRCTLSKSAQAAKKGNSTKMQAVYYSTPLMRRFAKGTTSAICALLWLPVALCIGIGRVVTRSLYYIVGMLGLAHAHDAPVIEQAEVLIDVKRANLGQKYTKVANANINVAKSTRRTELTTSTSKSWFSSIVESIQHALWWPIASLIACSRWSWCTVCYMHQWVVVQALYGALLWVADKLHFGIAKYVIVDTVLLSRTGYIRKAYGCCCWLVPIFLIPLLLTCGYYAYARSFSKSTTKPFAFTTNLPISNAESAKAAAAAAVALDTELMARVQSIVFGLLREHKTETHTILSQDWRNWADEYAADQSAAMISHRAEVNAMIAALVKEHIGVLAAGVRSRGEESSKQEEVLVGQREKIKSLEDQISAIVAQTKTLNAEIIHAKSDMNSADAAERETSTIAVANLQEQVNKHADDLNNLQSSHGMIAAAFKNCCKNDSALALMIRQEIEEYLAHVLSNSGNDGTLPIGGPGMGSSETWLLSWLKKQFVGHSDLHSQLATLLAKVRTEERTKSTQTPKSVTDLPLKGGVTKQDVDLLIQQALMLYSADKTGMVDYALESAGGSVISTRCSETYHRRTAQLSLFGIPLWYTSNSPRTVIQPDMQPGQCWAYQGNRGYLVIQMASYVHPTAFTMEHIPKILSPNGKIESAPKEFTVLGLKHDRDRGGVFLGNYTYREQGKPLQTFLVTEPNSKSFSIIELQINTNHGNKEYTCLYRFRIHGDLDI